MPQEVQNRSAETVPFVSRKFTTVTTLAAYCTVILVGITHHEPFHDEAQAWLMSRDLGYRYLVFHQLAYEGNPPLWPTILWVANHWFHLPYQSIGWIAGMCAIAGCWFFARYSPFPAVIRILLPFTYFIAFQFAIVARPYVLLPLFAFAAAHFFHDADSHPWRFVVAVSALALLCGHGVMLAVGLVASRVWYAFRKWDGVPLQARKGMIGAAIVFGIVIAFVALVNWPPADRTFLNTGLDRPASAGDVLPGFISVAFFGSPIPSMAFLVVVGAFCANRRRFLPFALPMAFTLAFFVKVYGNVWHGGALTLIAFAALWMAWPCQERADPKLDSGLKALVLVGLAVLFAVHIYWTARTLALDYSGAYSGSLDAAKYLRSVGADASSTCGFDYESVAVQAYFPKSIFSNFPQGESFWRWDPTNRINQSCDHAIWIVGAISGPPGKALQEFSQGDRLVRSRGFVPVHISKGQLFFEGGEGPLVDFVIYKYGAGG